MKKKWIIIAAAIVLVLAITATVTITAGAAVIVSNQPALVAKNAITNAVSDLTERDEIAPMLSMLKRGSLEVTAEINTEELEGTLDKDVKSIQAGGKIYFGEKKLFVDDLNATIVSDDFYKKLNVNADVFISEEYSYITEDKYLNGSYGIIREGITDAFKTSAISKQLNAYQRKQIVSILESYENGDSKAFEKDTKKIEKRYEKIFLKSLKNYAEIDSERKAVEIGEERINSREITIIIDADTLLYTMQDIYAEMEQDKALRAYFIDHQGYFANTEAFKKEGLNEHNAGEIYDDMLDSFEEALEELEEEAPDMDERLIIKIATPTMSSTLRKLTVSYDSGDKIEDVIVLDLGKNGIKKSDLIQLTIKENITFKMRVKEDSRERYSAKIEYHRKAYGYRTEDIERTLASIDIIKKNDTFKLELDDGNVKLSGNWTKALTTTTIVLNEVETEETDLPDGFSVTVVIKEIDFMPMRLKPESIENVFEISDRRMENINENIQELSDDFKKIF